MEITGIISALFIGLVIGGLGRLVVPGRQRVSLLTTTLVGIAAALVGTFAASVLGVADTGGVDWLELALQVGLAGVGVAVLSGRAKVRQHQ
ncbi:GlsB/YeaQ/YmgE family stress response membrane protein [Saccharothrix algeriensis]|uniref:GlsB/YeaQ/YmgE family stress response membrane protein n=1 Tax=Saccharothrix algeriensis TaxID=173560 RepID=A0A8T8I533_9PSEU|nr:GlsB/YeaQ/YmgE family stress response membrane protein [Saccharothrix algeriensis]MBM7811132.1 putative membrane protein YeaQ/YmgE (transglycosylase-associated protein family) [Saccharothrix algeriensis]QTR05064.1 GlsB/YeaQ/YmgE family stress response membrane protein [Saccharothrix algeriensis]